MNAAKPYKPYDKKFCKVVIKTTNGEKALKGILKVFDTCVHIKGDFQETTVSLSDIVRITTRGEPER